ncbi:hypothetical protein PQQ51_31545 [Paraburkholderia xenovorans]|uniref:hypothetical protein n=1 Tax=Paraburkholderia xenovorans TaxID=36873 RepID=UPI0038BC8327
MNFKTLLIAASLALPLSAHAYQLDRTIDCSLSVHDFFAPLVQSHAIQTPAFRTMARGVNAFHKSSNDALTFFNMTVGDVVGYSDEPLFFITSDAPDRPEGYGFLVNAPIAEVQAVMSSIGNTAAQVRRLQPDVTYIFCEVPRPQ